jgi:hypothetical protein
MKNRNFALMRKFLLILFVVLSLSGFSQNLQTNSSGWGNQLSDENNLTLELRVYPNPSTDGKVTIEFNNQEISEIRLTNITGKEVFLKKFQFAENKKQIQFNDIPNGLYILRIKTSDHKQVMKKLMLAKN